MPSIYIVEDDNNILEIETYALKSSGYDVSGFENAEAFYKQLSVCIPELVILDILIIFDTKKRFWS